MCPAAATGPQSLNSATYQHVWPDMPGTGPSPPWGPSHSGTNYGGEQGFRPASPPADDSQFAHPSQGVPLHFPHQQRAFDHPRRREADKVDIPPLPALIDRDDWVIQVEQNVLSASARSDQENVMKWIQTCRRETADPERVFGWAACPEELRSLDAKLAQALKERIRTGKEAALRYAIERLDADATNAGMPLSGRHTLHRVLTHYSINDGQAIQRVISQMHSLDYPPGDKPEAVEKWANYMDRHIKDAVKLGMPDHACLGTLREKLRAATALQPRILAYENATPVPERTWGKLLGEVFAWLQEQRNCRMRQEIGQNLRASYMKGAKPAAAVETRVPKSTAPKPRAPVNSSATTTPPPTNAPQ